MTLLYPTHLKIKFSSSLQVHGLCNFPLSQLSTSTVHIPSSALVRWTELVNHSYIMDVTSIFHLASFYLSWVERNRGHIIYKTVLLLTCRTCSIPQRMNSTGKFTPQPTPEFTFGAIFCKAVSCVTCLYFNKWTFELISFRACHFHYRKKNLHLCSLSPLDTATATFTQHCPSKASPTAPSSTLQPRTHGLSALLCPSTNQLPSLHRNTSVGHLTTVRKAFPGSTPSDCREQQHRAATQDKWLPRHTPLHSPATDWFVRVLPPPASTDFTTCHNRC